MDPETLEPLPVEWLLHGLSAQLLPACPCGVVQSELEPIRKIDTVVIQ